MWGASLGQSTGGRSAGLVGQHRVDDQSDAVEREHRADDGRGECGDRVVFGHITGSWLCVDALEADGRVRDEGETIKGQRGSDDQRREGGDGVGLRVHFRLHFNSFVVCVLRVTDSVTEYGVHDENQSVAREHQARDRRGNLGHDRTAVANVVHDILHSHFLNPVRRAPLLRRLRRFR